MGYRYYQTVSKPVCFPFGFGLSYTSFAYSDLEVSREKISFTLANTGDRPGAEVAQVYISAPRDKILRPALELKGFQKVFLQPGERRRVTIPLDEYAFRWFNPQSNRWEVEEGTYWIHVGMNAEELPLSAPPGGGGDRSGRGIRPRDNGLLFLWTGGGGAG